MNIKLKTLMTEGHKQAFDYPIFHIALSKANSIGLYANFEMQEVGKEYLGIINIVLVDEQRKDHFLDKIEIKDKSKVTVTNKLQEWLTSYTKQIRVVGVTTPKLDVNHVSI